MNFNIMLRAGALALIVALAAILSLPARAEEAKSEESLISMTGTGTVNAAPDMAIVTSGVVTEGKSAREALSGNNAAMAKVIATLKGAGIEDRDIQTSGFAVNPLYSHYRPKEGEEARPPKIVGYQVANNVTVRVRDLEKLGPVLDQLVSDGANTINGIQFTIDDDEALLDEARKNAVADAIRKAKILTEAAGVKLGRIVSMTEDGGAMQPVPVMRMARAEAAMKASVPVEAGEQTLRVNVSIVWEIQQ